MTLNPSIGVRERIIGGKTPASLDPRSAASRWRPKVGSKPLVQAKPKEPMGCKLVGTVKAPSCGLVTAWDQSFAARHLGRSQSSKLGLRETAMAALIC
jgi:hypothetical protein